MAYQQFKNISEAGEAGEAGDECRLLSSPDPAQPFDRRRSLKDTSKHIIIGCLICLLLLLSVTNATTAIYLAKVKQDLDYHRYSSLESVEEYWTTFETMTEFSSSDPAIVDAAWQKYVINGFVTLPNSWAENRHWPTARPMPGTPSQGIYVVDGFHQLHCLMSIRETISTLVDGNPVYNRTHTMRHLNHCYDALRQAIVCRADDTPLYVPKDTFWAGDGQERRCRDWKALEDWVIRHTACQDPVGC